MFGIHIHLTIHIMACSHDSTTVSRPLRQTNKLFLEANSNHIVTARLLMGLFCKTELQALVKCLASTCEVHDLQTPAVVQSVMTGT